MSKSSQSKSIVSHIMPTYFSQFPIAFERGEGAWLWDTEGKKYIDALSGIAVCSLGHAHPAITKTICEQASKLLQASNAYRTPHQEKLATLLCDISGMEQVYFCNSGAEANETAIKLSRLYARKKNIAKPVIITMQNSFHGRSMATLSATGATRIQEGFEPLVDSFVHLPLNDIAALEKTVAENANIIGIMLECVQGDGGLYAASPEFMLKIRSLCDEKDLLMIVDEVQTGLCRTGKWFAFQHYNIQPDIVSVAKALGNGVPIGASLAQGKATNLFGAGKHGTTFGGNPFVSAVGCTVIETMQQLDLPNHVSKISDYFFKKLHETFKNNPHVINIRGQGLMIGVELDTNAFDLLPIGQKHGVILNIVSNKTIRIIPPLIITEKEVDEIVSRLNATILEARSEDCA